MYNNESDDISEEEKPPLKKSYIVYVIGALFATPVSVYVFHSIYWFFRYDYREIPPFLEALIFLAGLCLTIGPTCALILLIKAYKDKEKKTLQKVIYALVLPLSLFISFLTFLTVLFEASNDF